VSTSRKIIRLKMN